MIKAIKAKYVIAPNNSYQSDSAVLVAGDTIQGIVPNKEIDPKKYKVVDLKNSVLLPGFVNSHIHLELQWVQKLLEPFDSFPSWLNQIIKLKNEFDNLKIPSYVEKSLKESLDSGVTTIGEIASYDGLDFKPIIQSRVRVVYFYEIANSTIMNINSKFLKKLLKIKKNPLFNLRIFPHSVYSLDTKSIRKLFSFAKKNNLDLGIHLSESLDEVKYTKKLRNNIEDKVFSKFPIKPRISLGASTPLEYLDKINNSGQNITLVHMNNLSNNDQEILKKRGYPVVLCPRSNLYLNQKLPNINFFMQYDKTGLGTDGLSSNLSINFLDEINFLYLHAKKLNKRSPERRVLEIATLGGAKALGLDNLIGSIEPNKKADLIAFELLNKDPFLSLMHSKKKNLKMSMVNGQIIKLK